jgi:hypothetical protein
VTPCRSEIQYVSDENEARGGVIPLRLGAILRRLETTVCARTFVFTEARIFFRIELRRETLIAAFYTGSLALLSLAGIASASAAEHRANPLAEHVRTANDRFKDVSVAVSEGYAPIPCTSGIDGGAMGVHYVNAKLIGDDVDIKHPQAVMYEPKPDGKMELVAVEYITSKGPASLEGQLFNFNGAPNRYGLGPFYELHVWAWKANPHGAFADMNPSVSCEHASMK